AQPIDVLTNWERLRPGHRRLPGGGGSHYFCSGSEQETSTIDVPVRIQIGWNRLAHLIRQLPSRAAALRAQPPMA
ncbi:MAG: hypothetical protein WA794_01860, partial [Trebonia sp.]